MSNKTPEKARDEQVIRSLLQRITPIGVHNLTVAKSAILATLGIAAAAGSAYATDQNPPVKTPLPTFDQLDSMVNGTLAQTRRDILVGFVGMEMAI